MTESDNKSLNRGLRQNKIILCYVMAVDQALLLSTLVAYGAYICICESGLGTMKEASSASQYDLDFRKAGLWKWIGLNIAVNATLSLLFLLHPSRILLVLIILTAGWQKYMDGRIPPRLQATRRMLVL